MPKLYMVYLGGQATGSNIEVHDVRFVIGENIEETFHDLRSQWFGELNGLHMDCYTQIESIDGYRVELKDVPSDSILQPYFVNLGGYDPNVLGELHEDGLFVAKNANDAKEKALATLLTGTQQTHKDNIMVVDHCLTISKVGSKYLHLTESVPGKPLKPDWYGYHRIDIQE